MVIRKAYDCYIEDESGKRFIDTSMGSGVQIIGHNNPLIRKIGKQIFIFLFVISLILILPTGSMAVDAKHYILDYLGATLNGAMLVFLYFTPIKKEFDK